jgi:hypothetical protein
MPRYAGSCWGSSGATRSDNGRVTHGEIGAGEARTLAHGRGRRRPRSRRVESVTTIGQGYRNTKLCYYRLKKVLLALLVTHFLCVPIGRVTIEPSIGTHLFTYWNICLVLP